MDLSKHHWNYFLAIEKDLENVSRYIEFSPDNSGTYSIELAHILLSASSEVDVVMKQLWKLLDIKSYKDKKKKKCIDNYRQIIQNKLPDIINKKVYINRYSITSRPWEVWAGTSTTNPDWWSSYNKVKHERNVSFKEANLKNTINAVSALFLVVVYFYKTQLEIEGGRSISSFDEVFYVCNLKPESTFLKLNSH